MLKIEHLKKSYENFSLDCSLEVKKGHVTGLIGQNGAGKSTTDIVVGFGGYPSASALEAAASLKIKTMIHEQNSIIGLTNKIL